MIQLQKDLEQKFEHRRRLGSMRDFLVKKIVEKQAEIVTSKEVIVSF